MRNSWYCLCVLLTRRCKRLWQYTNDAYITSYARMILHRFKRSCFPWSSSNENCCDCLVFLFFFQFLLLVFSIPLPSTLGPASMVLSFSLKLTFPPILSRLSCFLFTCESDTFLAARIPCLTDLVIVGVDLIGAWIVFPFMKGPAREQA